MLGIGVGVALPAAAVTEVSDVHVMPGVTAGGGVKVNLTWVSDPNSAGTRVCERTGCRHRSIPPIGQRLDVGTGERGVIPYRICA